MAACVMQPATGLESILFGANDISRANDQAIGAAHMGASKRRFGFDDLRAHASRLGGKQMRSSSTSSTSSSSDQAPHGLPRPDVIEAFQRNAGFYAASSPGSPTCSTSSSLSSASSCDMEYLQQCLDEEHKSEVPCPSYLTKVQRDMDAHKRLVLVDWLIEVADEFKLRQETLFLAVNLLDRFLSVQHVQKAELQLVGVTALWLACKYEEVYPPVLADFVEITDRAYSARQLVAMEAAMLRQLHFQLAVPTAIGFLHQLLSAHEQEGSDERGSVTRDMPCASGRPHTFAAEVLSRGGRRLVHLAEYLLELMLLNPEALRWRPSLLAAAALQVARQQLAQPEPDELVDQLMAGCSDDLKLAGLEMLHMARWASSACTKRPMVWTKYAQKQRSHVALLCTGTAWP